MDVRTTHAKEGKFLVTDENGSLGRSLHTFIRLNCCAQLLRSRARYLTSLAPSGDRRKSWIYVHALYAINGDSLYMYRGSWGADGYWMPLPLYPQRWCFHAVTCFSNNRIFNSVYITHKMWNLNTMLFGKTRLKNQIETICLKQTLIKSLISFNKKAILILCW